MVILIVTLTRGDPMKGYFLSSGLVVSMIIVTSGYSHRSHFITKKIFASNPKKESLNEYAIPPKQTQSTTSPPITIWIYGTLLLKKSFFYTYFDGITGLKKASELFKSPKYPGKIARWISNQKIISFPLETFYFFGWTGKLNNSERWNAAQILHTQLKQLISDYQSTFGHYPQIRLICHSHGGNVALYLAQLEENNPSNIIIENLVLLACPVQRCTIKYIEAPLFKKIYALYSSLDVIQVLAPQHPYYRPFSAKRFPTNSKTIQAKIKINGHALLHTSFTKQRFVRLLPTILKELEFDSGNVSHNYSKDFVLNIRSS